MYSKEDGTPAALMKDQIHTNTKKSRYNKIMKIQSEISKENLEKKIGKEVEVLIENISFDNKFLIGRTSSDVPEIDGLVYVKVEEEYKQDIKNLLNTYINCVITDVNNYDLIAKVIQKKDIDNKYIKNRASGIIQLDNGYTFIHRTNVKDKMYEDYYVVPGGRNRRRRNSRNSNYQRN